MKKYSSLFLALIACATFQTGCKTTPSKAPASAAATGMQKIGWVALVNEAQGFVLVETAGGAAGTAGSEWVSRGPGGEADLKVSDQARKPFTVADIVGGNPQRGDAVYQPVPKSAMDAAEAAAKAASAGPTQMLQDIPAPVVPDMN